MEENKENRSLEIQQGPGVKKSFLFFFATIIVIFIILIGFVLTEERRRQVATSNQEQAVKIPLRSELRMYYSKELKLALYLHAGESGEERAGVIRLTSQGKKGEIIMERYLMNNNSENFSDLKGQVANIGSHEKIYYIDLDNYIYAFHATNPDLFTSTERIIKDLRYVKNEKEFFRVPSKPEILSIIQRKTPKGTVNVFDFGKYSNNFILRWKNLLLYSYRNVDNGYVTIFGYDISTGKEKIIFNKKSDQYMIAYILEDTLYVSLGAYLKKGETYWIDLNTNDNVVHYLTDQSGTIEKIEGHYFFMSGEGDACWSYSSFSLLNPSTKVLTPVVHVNSGCVDGDHYFGINNDDQMVLASYVKEDFYSTWNPEPIYSRVILIPLNLNKQREYVVLPAKIVHIEKIEEGLLLVGREKIYIYSFKNKSFQEIVILPGDWINLKLNTQLNSLDKKSLCIEKMDEAYVKGMHIKVNLEKKTLIKNDGPCVMPQPKVSQKPQLVKSEQEKVKKIFDDLNLPKEYVLVQEPF